MKNACSVTLILLALSLVAPALPEPNLSGTWVINQINGQAVPGGPPAFLITQNGNEFVVESVRRSPMSKQEYLTDGTERKLPQVGTPTSTYYTAKWEGESLIIDKIFKDTRPWPGPMGIQGIEPRPAMSYREVWSISADGKNLTHLMKIGNSQDTFTGVYQRVSHP